MAKKVRWIVVIVLGGLAIWAGLWRTMTGTLLRWGVRLESQGFSLDRVTKEIQTLPSEEFWASSGTRMLSVRRTLVQDTLKMVSDRKFLLRSLYEPTVSPYPEVISQTIACSEEFRPAEEVLSHGSLFRLRAGERFAYGICVADLIKYYSVYGIFDCQKKGVFEVRVFDTADEIKNVELVKSFVCQR